jgi:peptidoglycan biosynthesis protein MviN/MurJ (putative lipid II flippase)
LSLVFVTVYKFGVWSIAVSYSIAAILDLLILLYLLGRKIGGFDMGRLFNPLAKISMSAAAMGASLYFPMKWLDFTIFDTSRTLPLLGLTAVAGIAGMLSYLFFTWVFKVEEIELLYKLVRKLNFTNKHQAAAQMGELSEEMQN